MKRLVTEEGTTCFPPFAATTGSLMPTQQQEGSSGSAWCVKNNGQKLGEQKMSDLPIDRISADLPPFTYVGVDYFGPIEVKRGRSVVKRYGVLFTCLTCCAFSWYRFPYKRNQEIHLPQRTSKGVPVGQRNQFRQLQPWVKTSNTGSGSQQNWKRSGTGWHKVDL